MEKKENVEVMITEQGDLGLGIEEIDKKDKEKMKKKENKES